MGVFDHCEVGSGAGNSSANRRIGTRYELYLVQYRIRTEFAYHTLCTSTSSSVPLSSTLTTLPSNNTSRIFSPHHRILWLGHTKGSLAEPAKMKLLLFASVALGSVSAFVPATFSRRTTTALNAINVLAKKAKEDEVLKYLEDCDDEAVLTEYEKIKEKAGEPLPAIDGKRKLHEILHRRRRNVMVIAEYRRKLEMGGTIDETFDCELLSPAFREFQASAIAVLADERMGGCNYDDLQDFLTEQHRARLQVPGPVPIINSDLIVHEIQVARSKAMGCAGILLDFSIIGEDRLVDFLKATHAVDLEAIVTVSTAEDAQKAVDLGAQMVRVNIVGAHDMVELLQKVKLPEDTETHPVCMIAYLSSNKERLLSMEIEDAWVCRDGGYNAVWAADILYKYGRDPTAQPGALIKTMKSKTSLKWGSRQTMRGSLEGAKEYLGDILM